MKKSLLLVLLLFVVFGLNAKIKEYDLKHWPEGKSPVEIGTRIADKFLKTAHSRYGNTHPETPPTQITYPDVCAWLGGMWFAEITKNDELFKIRPLLNRFLYISNNHYPQTTIYNGLVSIFILILILFIKLNLRNL